MDEGVIQVDEGVNEGGIQLEEGVIQVDEGE